MKILRFKLGGKYEYNVSFETAFEKKKIETNDKPTGDLRAAAQNVTLAAVKYFRFQNMLCALRQITFSYPDGDNDTFTLELDARVSELSIEHVIRSKKIDITEYETKSPGLVIGIEQKNLLVKNVLNLRDEIEKYVLGMRDQQELRFTLKTAKDGGDAELFHDEETGMTVERKNIPDAVTEIDGDVKTVENWEDIDTEAPF
jgi:hypothetical protein